MKSLPFPAAGETAKGMPVKACLSQWCIWGCETATKRIVELGRGRFAEPAAVPRIWFPVRMREGD